MQHASDLMIAHPVFKPCVESMAIPGQPGGPTNMLMFKGSIVIAAQPGLSFRIKVVLVNGYPYRPPKVYLDQQLSQAIAAAKQWIGQFNEITIPYLQGWNMNQNSNLRDLLQFLNSVIQSDPPIAGGPTGAPQAQSYKQPGQYLQATQQPMNPMMQ